MLGDSSGRPCDYPDGAYLVARAVVGGTADLGVLVCGSGIGMSMAANRFPRVRAALCVSPEMAKMARTHNDANILVLGGKLVSREESEAILAEWLENDFSAEELMAHGGG